MQVIEYVGELVRHIVGDIRDDYALEKGKSTYMFRIDDDYIVDSMFKVPPSAWQESFLLPIRPPTPPPQESSRGKHCVQWLYPSEKPR